MTLREKQSQFAYLVAKLIFYAEGLGYEVTFGETYRSDEESKRLASLGKGIHPSLHNLRLAVDLNLFKDGKLLQRSKDHEELGKFWESLSSKNSEFECCWGGTFNDGNHYSITHAGLK